MAKATIKPTVDDIAQAADFEQCKKYCDQVSRAARNPVRKARWAAAASLAEEAAMHLRGECDGMEVQL